MYRGGQKWVYSCSCAKRHAGCDYYNSFNSSVFRGLTTVNLRWPAPGCSFIRANSAFLASLQSLPEPHRLRFGIHVKELPPPVSLKHLCFMFKH